MTTLLALAQTTIDNGTEAIYQSRLIAYLVELLTAIWAGLGM